jgi:hypothetical protein
LPLSKGKKWSARGRLALGVAGVPITLLKSDAQVGSDTRKVMGKR